jgi:hypothetical protein
VSLSLNGSNSSILAFGKNGSSENYILADAGGFTIANTSATLPTIFFNNAAERMRIDSSGNIQQGTYSDTTVKSLQLRTNKALLTFEADGATDANGSAINYSWVNGGQGPLKFKNASSTVMTLDASGNLNVGVSSAISAATNTDDGFTFAPNSGYAWLSVSDNGGIYVQRQNDNKFFSFYKGTTAVGSIAVQNSTLQIGTSNTNLSFSDANDALYIVNAAGVERDGDTDLGKNDARFNDIYATNGTIQTSDRNEKQDIEALSDAEQRVAVAAKGLLRKFRWIDSVADKGDEARIHFGIIAQDLQDAFTAEGLDAGRYAMFISTTWTDEETSEERTRMGVRYSELLAFIIAAI